MPAIKAFAAAAALTFPSVQALPVNEAAQVNHIVEKHSHSGQWTTLTGNSTSHQLVIPTIAASINSTGPSMTPAPGSVNSMGENFSRSGSWTTLTGTRTIHHADKRSKEWLSISTSIGMPDVTLPQGADCQSSKNIFRCVSTGADGKPSTIIFPLTPLVEATHIEPSKVIRDTSSSEHSHTPVNVIAPIGTGLASEITASPTQAAHTPAIPFVPSGGSIIQESTDDGEWVMIPTYPPFPIRTHTTYLQIPYFPHSFSVSADSIFSDMPDNLIASLVPRGNTAEESTTTRDFGQFLSGIHGGPPNHSVKPEPKTDSKTIAHATPVAPLGTGLVEEHINSPVNIIAPTSSGLALETPVSPSPLKTRKHPHHTYTTETSHHPFNVVAPLTSGLASEIPAPRSSKTIDPKGSNTPLAVVAPLTGSGLASETPLPITPHITLDASPYNVVVPVGSSLAQETPAVATAHNSAA